VKKKAKKKAKKKRVRESAFQRRQSRWLENEQYWTRILEARREQHQKQVAAVEGDYKLILKLNQALEAENRLYKATVAEMEVYHEEALRKLARAHPRVPQVALVPPEEKKG